MGYRSQVAYTIRFIAQDDADEKIVSAKQAFFIFLAEAKSKEETALCFTPEEAEYLEVDEDKLELRFYASDVKWYDEYIGVKCHEELISLSKEWSGESNIPFKGGNKQIGGAFARIGEDSDDNVEQVWGSGDYGWVGVNRSVYCDWKD